MAEIPVERRSNGKWLWIILALIAAALLIWWIVDENQEEPLAGIDGVAPMVEPAPVDNALAPDAAIPPGADANLNAAAPATGPITELALLTGPAGALVGRTVRLEGVTATNVVGDRTFFVGEGANRMMVLIPEVRAGLPNESNINVNDGDRVSFTGTVQRVDNGRVAGEPIEGLPAGAEAVIIANTIQPAG